jgi:hypothetical protein
MKTFDVIHIQTGTVVETFYADYYTEPWGFEFYVKTKWYQRNRKVGQFPYYNNVYIKERNDSNNQR